MLPNKIIRGITLFTVSLGLFLILSGCNGFVFYTELDGLEGKVLSLTPSSVTVPVFSACCFTASGGVPPYTFLAGSGTAEQTDGEECEYTAPGATGTDTVFVIDSRGNQEKAVISIVTTGPLRISPSSMSIIVTNTATFTGSGGVPPYSYTASDGVIDYNTGAYTAPVFSCTDTITIRDAENNQNTAEITVTSTGPLTISPSTVTLVTNGAITLSAIGGDPPYTFTISAGAGILNPPGPPFGSTVVYTAPGTSGSAKVRVEDNLANFVEADITVVPTGALTISPSSITLLVDNQVTFSASGGDLPYAFSAAAGVINPTTGEYQAPSTLPAPNPTIITVQDGSANTDTASVTVFEVLSINPLSIEIPVKSTYQFSASGGFGSYTYSKVSGDGSINSSTGLYTAPTVIGSAVIQVEDDIGNKSQANITINSPGPLAISPVYAQVHLKDTIQYFASGGKAPYTFAVVSGGETIDPVSGLYTASNLAGTDTIRVTDDLSSTVDATAEIVWNISTVDLVNAGKYVCLTLDASGNPHVSYHADGINYLKYAFWDGDSWNSQTVDSTGDVGEYTSIDIDGNGYPHISYYDNSNDDLKYATYDGSWHITTVDSADKVGKYTSIAVDSSDNIHISYWHEDNKELRYAYYDGSWSIDVVDSTAQVGEYTSIALDSSDQPHISYYSRDNENLKYAYYNGSWNISTIDSSGKVGKYTSIAVDSSDNIHISYWHEDNKDLRYAYYDGSWSIDVVDTIGDVGKYTSIALEGEDPRISYRDNTNSTLKFASWNGLGWDMQTVFDGGNVLYTSASIDSNGNPKIAFYNDTAKDLMFAD